MVNVDAGFNIVPDSAKLSSETLRDTLDDLLERYLNLLHEYQLLQHNLTKTMSSVNQQPSSCWCICSDLFFRGFSLLRERISPTQTVYAMVRIFTMIGCKLQFDCTLQTRFLMKLKYLSPCYSNVADQTEGTSSPGQFEQSARDIISVSTLQPMSKGTESKQAKDDERLESVEKAAELKASTLDPLLWFGVLVPPTIKASQSSFRDAVTTTIPSLANVSKEMKDLEIEIRRTRKKITKAG